MLVYWQPLSALAGAVPCFSLAYTLTRVWRDPESVEEGQWVRFGIAILIMEFLVIHSGGQIASFGQQRGWAEGLALIVLLPITILFAWVVAYIMKSTPLFWSFVALVIGRLVVILFDESGEGLAFMVERMRVSVLIYFPLVFLTVTRFIPPWGMADPKYAEALQANGTTGVWVEHPHRAIGAAAMYFFLLGVAEISYLSHVSL